MLYEVITLFRKSGEMRERAHGDGMMIDFDSPEALEEMELLDRTIGVAPVGCAVFAYRITSYNVCYTKLLRCSAPARTSI